MFAAINQIGRTMTDTTGCSGLYARTLDLAKRCPRHIKQYDIAEATGIGESYLSELINGKKANPSVHIVQRLHDYLVTVCL